MGDGVPETDLVKRLSAVCDEELVAILAAADAADAVMHTPGGAQATPAVRPLLGKVEIVLLGALGCRYGMLAGGAGGHLVRTATATVLIDPGPAALTLLLQLIDQARFTWSELDAICVTHFHPDHYTDLIPCAEAMAAHTTGRPLLVANPTTAQRFTAFSPYHAGGMADVVTLAHPDTEGDGEPCVKVGDLTIHATPALHTEETGRTRSAIGLAYETRAGAIWYTADTNLAPGLLDRVAEILPETALVIAHADASNIDQAPGRAQACHLETRDVPTIAATLRPAHILIQHYDAAYSTPEYRIAQALWLQRTLDRDHAATQILPSASGLRLTLSGGRITEHALELDSDAGPSVAGYLQANS
jgi:ribonuclease BN (tRNA processing enzyme)